MVDLSWWNPDAPAMTPAERNRLLGLTSGGGRKDPKPQGYADTPGTGPEGQTCKTCQHIARIEHSKTYLKCGLMRQHWTGGGRTDIRAGSPACKLWEANDGV